MARDADYEAFLEWKRERDRRADSSRRPTPRGNRRDDDDAVLVFSGRRADALIERIFGAADALDDDDQADEPDDDDQADDDETDEPDDAPADPPTTRQGHRYFESHRRAG